MKPRGTAANGLNQEAQQQMSMAIQYYVWKPETLFLNFPSWFLTC